MGTSPLDAGPPGALPCLCWLPDDIVANIFARLPAKSVCQCRCLSRAWAATLSSDDFVDRYHRLANRRHSPRVFFLHYSFHDGPQMHVWSQDRPSTGGSSRMDVLRATIDDDDVPQTGMNFNALRLATLQCRGLVVLEDSDTEINYLCNPSTGQMAALPLPQGQKMWHENVLNQHYAGLGLGYDDVHAKKHKVVRINYGGCGPQGLPRSVACEVYVVNSTGRWQPIREKPPAWVRYYEPSVCAQGHVHWLAHHRKVNISASDQMSIVSFSLTDHTFGTVPPPPEIMQSQSLSKHELTELDGHLCLFSYNVSRSSRYDIWLLLPELDGARVWNLRCRIDLSKVSPDITDRFVRCRLHPLALINNGSRILLVQPRIAFADNYSRLCAYDPVTGDVEDMFSGSSMVYDCIMCSIDAAVYEESIISLG